MHANLTLGSRGKRITPNSASLLFIGNLDQPGLPNETLFQQSRGKKFKTHISYMDKEVMVTTRGIKEDKWEDSVKRNKTAAVKVEQV